MTSTRRNTLAAALLAAGFTFAAAPLVSAAPATGAPSAEMQARLQAHQQARLERMANRLEIKASQQDAWAAYAKVRSQMFAQRPTAPAQDADAATLARYHADRAAQMAQKLSTLADATAQLQQALTPAQAKTLAEMTRHSGAGHSGGRHGGKSWGGHQNHQGDQSNQGPRGQGPLSDKGAAS